MARVYVLFEGSDEFGLDEVLSVYRSRDRAIEAAKRLNKMGRACYVEEFNLVD